jgi:hypothetical protein
MTSDLGMTSSRRRFLTDGGESDDDESDDDAAGPGSPGAAGKGTASPSAETGVVMRRP